MLSYWVAVFEKAFKDSLDFVGQTKAGLAYTGLVLILTVIWLLKKHGGLKAAMREAWKTFGEGMLIAIAAFVLVFVGHFIAEPHLLDEDMKARWDQALEHKQVSEMHLLECGSQLSSQTFRGNFLQDSITSSQTQLNSQQGTINSCVVSLGKMNPIIREKITVVQVSIGTMDFEGRSPLSARINPNQRGQSLLKRYITELFILTNVSERNFHGVLRCDTTFSFIDPPIVTSDSSPAEMVSIAPKPIGDLAYEVRYETQPAPDWNDSHPAYMRVISKAENLGRCSFEPIK